MLTEADRDYLKRRRKFLKHLGPVAVGLCLAWVGCLAFMALHNPRILDPVGVIQGTRDGSLSAQHMRTLAVMAPMLYVCVLVVISLSLYTYIRGAYRERHLLEVVDRLERGSVTPS